MASDWKTCTLGELGPIRTGKTPASSLGDGFGGTVPFVTPGDMNGQKWITDTDRYLNENGLAAVSSSLMPARSVAVSCIGSDMGKAALLNRPSVTNQQINTIAVDESRFNAEFVYYDLSVRQQELKAAASGSATPILNKGHFSGFEISVPPRATQDKIAKILGRLDDKIDINRSINQTLEEMAQAIFKSWFVDFDPVKAKIAAIQGGRDPLRAAMSAISGKPEAQLDALPPEQFDQLAATAALFPDEMDDSELGEIPRGWCVVRVGSLLELVYGKALKAGNRNEGPIPVYGSGGITGSHDVALVPHGSIIVGRKGTVGSLYWEDKPFFPIDTTYYVRPLNAPLTYCYYLMQTLGLEKMNTDAAVPGLNRENVYRLESAQPDSIVLQRFDAAISVLRSTIRTNSGSIKSLAELRDTLLPKLLSGELSVNAATEIVAAKGAV